MLETQATEFLDYCKVAGFSPRFRQPLEISLRELTAFVASQAVELPEDITHGLLTDFVFVADFRALPFARKRPGSAVLPFSFRVSARRSLFIT